MLEKTFDPATAEPRLYAQWEASGAFRPEPALERNPDAAPFCMVIPPPNVTGSLHIGHALNNTLQDALARYHRMRGDAVLWLPGTDHAGIATQMVVERQLAAEDDIGRRDLGRDAFVERIWAWKAHSGGAITRQLRRLGASCDWSRERFTLDEGVSAAVRRVFVELYRQDLIYRDKRLVNWDPQFQTAISDLEVETREVDGNYWRFAYPLEDGSGEIVVATTRPETMLGDTAVAVHPADERYKHLIGRFVRLPIVERSIPIVGDEYADPKKGSGAVKITPAHDFNDFQVGKRQRLVLINILDDFGNIRANPESFAFTKTGRIIEAPNRANVPFPIGVRGMDRPSARRWVVTEMEELGFLRGIESTRHAVPHGDRSGAVIEPYLTDQWYVDAKTLAGPAIAAVEDGRTVFEPPNWEKTYFEWMRNIEPWCISRQLWWGHRIPAWLSFGQTNPDIFVAENKEDAVQQARATYPDGVKLEVFDGKDPAAQAFHADALLGKETSKIYLYQDDDVLDTWFSSALWPFSTLGWPEQTDDLARFYPTDTLVTGFDIIFFWVARMMMTGLKFQGQVPFKRVVINGLVRDERGQKMSKSKGNVIDPLDVIDELGADALRFTLAMLSGTRDIKLPKSRIEGYRNFGTKLWNAARFCQMNDCVNTPGFNPASVSESVNRWIRGEAVKTAQAVTAAFDAARFDDAATALYRFVWNVFCDWYVELIKPILNGDDEMAKAETRAMAAWTLDQALKLLHPISPFITEELWAQTAVARGALLIEAPWPDMPERWIDAEAQAETGWLIDLVTEVRSIRSEMNVPPGAKPALTLVGADAVTCARMARNHDRLTTLARLSQVQTAQTVPSGSVQFVAAEATGALAIADIIDLDAEKVRLTKALAGLEKELQRLQGKLGNADFIARAPDAVVEEQREKLAEATAAIMKMRAALAKLDTIG